MGGVRQKQGGQSRSTEGQGRGPATRAKQYCRSGMRGPNCWIPPHLHLHLFCPQRRRLAIRCIAVDGSLGL